MHKNFQVHQLDIRMFKCLSYKEAVNSNYVFPLCSGKNIWWIFCQINCKMYFKLSLPNCNPVNKITNFGSLRTYKWMGEDGEDKQALEALILNWVMQSNNLAEYFSAAMPLYLTLLQEL